MVAPDMPRTDNPFQRAQPRGDETAARTWSQEAGELGIRRRYKVNIIAIKKRTPVITEQGESSFQERTNDVPGPDDRIEPG